MAQAFFLVGWLVATWVAAPAAVGEFGSLVDDAGAPGIRSGACDLLSSDYGECSRCCEADTQAASISCRVAQGTLCTFPGCKLFGGTVCDKVTAQLKGACLDTNCGGKPGNPACTPPAPPCVYECKFKCGLTERGVCGDCSDLNPDFVCCGG